MVVYQSPVSQLFLFELLSGYTQAIVEGTHIAVTGLVTSRILSPVSQVKLGKRFGKSGRNVLELSVPIGWWKRLSGKKDEYWKYRPLVKAALKGNWDDANGFFKDHPEAITGPITRERESALYLASGVGLKAIPFVTKLLEWMPAEALEHRDVAGKTPLHLSALVGNAEAAELLVRKNRELLCMREDKGWLPVHYAATNKKNVAVNKKNRKTLAYLLKASIEYDAAKSMLFFSSEHDKPSATELLIRLITSGYYDIALRLVRRYPQLGLSQTPQNYDCGLRAIPRKDLNFWERTSTFGNVSSIVVKNYVEDFSRDDNVPVIKFENYAEDSNRAEIGIENPVNNSELPVQEGYWARCLDKYV
ncbi:hypothetical protein RHMOL_Rhmol05G0008500 [Rhododendron molle]|uniref:Uncharacterized protein n=1 Tax=Rhododendron molle TaxID=49168 RepID=A0ACC0NL68_RHOML|nr:hypothetical protein RHMOL_Rhmol05G0008500 [Rhododendron molle]